MSHRLIQFAGTPRTLLGMACVLFTLSACGDGADTADTPDANTVAVSGAADPCALLDDAFLATRFEMAGVQVTRTPGGEYIPHPFCRARWPKADSAAIEARQVASAGARAMAQARGEKPPAMERTHVDVTLTILKERAVTPEGAIVGFDDAMTMLKEGRQIQVTVEPVSGVADKAAWIAKLSELAVVSGRQRFSVTVQSDTDPAVDRGHAIAFAQALSRTLN